MAARSRKREEPVVTSDRDDADAGTTAPVGLTMRRYLLPCRTVSLGVTRIPAQATTDQPLALFLPGIMTTMADTCQRVLPLIKLLDVVICDLPGHGTSGELDDVSPMAFAQEYSALIDRYIPNPQQIYIVGESYGGLVGAALAAIRPDRVRHLFLLDTPLCLTRQPLRALLTERWQSYSLSPYIRRILLEVFNLDPRDGSSCDTKTYYSMFHALKTNCSLLAGSEDFAVGDPPAKWRPPSQLTDADLAAMASHGSVSVLPRIESAGHCLLLDNRDACVAAMARCMAG
jgi:pimeloyl-ACP methyl ester carboxylesterase